MSNPVSGKVDLINICFLLKVVSSELAFLNQYIGKDYKTLDELTSVFSDGEAEPGSLDSIVSGALIDGDSKNSRSMSICYTDNNSSILHWTCDMLQIDAERFKKIADINRPRLLLLCFLAVLPVRSSNDVDPSRNIQIVKDQINEFIDHLLATVETMSTTK